MVKRRKSRVVDLNHVKSRGSVGGVKVKQEGACVVLTIGDEFRYLKGSSALRLWALIYDSYNAAVSWESARAEEAGYRQLAKKKKQDSQWGRVC